MEIVSLFRRDYPDILIHNNQWARQWNPKQVKVYLKYAKPYLLTFDAYVFTDYGLFPVEGGSCNRMAMELAFVRHYSLKGHDSTGRKPIVFGQFVQDFKTGNGVDIGDYVITESQINLYNFLTTTLGGKWLMLFRWLQNNSDIGVLFDANGNPTQTYEHFQESNGEVMNHSPILSKLITTDSYYLPGEQLKNGRVITNPLLYKEMEEYLPYWKDAKSEYKNLFDLSAKNIGTVNLDADSKPLMGDLYVGFFKPLPAKNDFINQDGITEINDNYTYFMICNGLTWGDGIVDMANQQGKCEDSAQKITLSFKTDTLAEGKSVYCVTRGDGTIKKIVLDSNNQYSLY